MGLWFMIHVVLEEVLFLIHQGSSVVIEEEAGESETTGENSVQYLKFLTRTP